MAFNPFANFRKYQKIWMATILLVTMFTFVLCTGVGQGDLSDNLLRWFRSRGDVYARIDNRKLYGSDFDDLKVRRNIAHEFMKEASKVIAARLEEALRPENIKKLDDKNPKDAQRIRDLFNLRAGAEAKMRRQRFFETGVKIDELINFMVWLAEADRLRVELTDKDVRDLAALEYGDPDLLSDDVFRTAVVRAQFHSHRANYKLVLETLRDEYRVRLAQRVLGYEMPTRLAVAPGQMWEFYKGKRVEYRISLLPLNAEDFVKDVGNPDEVQLKLFFDQHRTQTVDPASDKIGFALPGRTKVTWVSIDPNSDHYKRATKLALELQAAPYLTPPPYAGLSFLSAAAAQTLAADQVYRGIGARSRFELGKWVEGDVDASVAAWLTQNDPAAIAGLIGAGAQFDAGLFMGPTAYRARLGHVVKRNQALHEAGVRDTIKARLPAYAGLIGMGAVHQGKAIPDVIRNLEFSKFDYLPLSVVQEDMLAILGREQARGWAQAHMQRLKQKLEDIKVLTSVAVQNVLRDHGQGIGLEQAQTSDFYHRFNIDQAKELEPLRKSFVAHLKEINDIEGRNLTPESFLKEGDFWRMFFGDGGEHFAASGAKYQAKPWPPIVKAGPQTIQKVRLGIDVDLVTNPSFRRFILAAREAAPGETVPFNLFETAERPFLFWRTADEPPLVPKDVGEVRAQVVEAWKLDKARDALLKRAEKIANTLKKHVVPGLEMVNAVDELKKEYKQQADVIPLSEVTPLVPNRNPGEQRFYTEFDVPRGLFKHPRKDMKDALLNLYDLKKPIEVGYAPLDKINKALFDEISKEKNPQGKYVQILTNQPRTMFYIAVVRDMPLRSHFDFNQTANAGHDTLWRVGQQHNATKLREDMMRQLRDAHQVEAPNEEIRRRFDSDVTS
jgi:hypothetical protein